MLNRLNVCRGAIVSFALILSESLRAAAADPWQLNMHKGVTPISHDIFYLHMVAMGVCAVIGVVVFGVMIYSLIHHRKSKGHKAATFHENIRVEIVWTIIPFLILIALAIPATKILMNLEDSSESDVTIKVVGSQWKWRYEYLDQGISFFSNLSTPFNQIENKKPKNQWYLLEVDRELIVPTNKKIRFLVTSTDVIHSWWVPELGVKRDAIPGFLHESWARIEKPGVYRGQCAELCGVSHGYMPIVVRAVPEQEFRQWAEKTRAEQVREAAALRDPDAQRTMSRAELVTLGKEKYDLICSACHQPDGSGIPPLYPALKNSSVATGHPISKHIQIILDGIPGSAMQAYRDVLSNEDIAAIVTYERSAWGNNTYDLVEPADVAKVRKLDQTKPKMVKKVLGGGLR